MCLILFSVNVHSRYRYVIAANRDEFYDRPTAPAHEWDDPARIIAGTDLKGGGTWMGITPGGKMAAITNFRQPSLHKKHAPSRGHLVLDYLRGNEGPRQYVNRVQTRADDYNGFNLLIGDPRRLYFFSNRDQSVIRIEPGVHGLSNHLLNTPWPKVQTGKQALKNLLEKEIRIDPEEIFAILKDKTTAEDNLLPDTGMGLEWERKLSPLFITTEIYGTRSSSVLLWDKDGMVTFIERNYDRKGIERPAGTRKFIIQLEPGASDSDY